MQGTLTVETRAIDDERLGRIFVGLRWFIAAAYIVLARTGVLRMSGDALVLSAGALCLYHAAFTWDRLSSTSRRLVVSLSGYVDVVMTSGALAAVHDAQSPLWAVYFISIVGVAHTLTPRRMIAFTAWAIANYLAAAGAIVLLGHAVSGGYVAVVSVLIVFMGLNAIILAGGEQRMRDVIAKLAVTDSLTGLPNRRRFQDLYRHRVDDAQERRAPLALMLVDVDHFKEINDRYGHPAGDDKLRQIAQALADVTRGSDTVARYGGDEFIVIAPDVSQGDAVALAERLRAAALTCGMEVSIGVALFPGDAQRHDALIEAADRALYAAKKDGRNCVRMAAAA